MVLNRLRSCVRQHKVKYGGQKEKQMHKRCIVDFWRFKGSAVGLLYNTKWCMWVSWGALGVRGSQGIVQSYLLWPFFLGGGCTDRFYHSSEAGQWRRRSLRGKIMSRGLQQIHCKAFICSYKPTRSQRTFTPSFWHTAPSGGALIQREKMSLSFFWLRQQCNEVKSEM